MLALIDADIIAYRSAITHESKFDFPVISDLEDAINLAINMVEQIRDTVIAENVLLCFSASSCYPDRYTNFRRRVMREYKAGRKEPPSLLHDVQQALMNAYDYRLQDGLEGDDLLGIFQGMLVNTVICTIDKDLDQIPGEHYNWDKETYYTTTADEGLRFFYKQALMGDTCDGYKGAKGVGTKTADKILDTLEDLNNTCEVWKVIKEVYESKGQEVRDALRNFRVAKMLTKDDVEYKGDTLYIKLWSPIKNRERYLSYERQQERS